MEPTQMVHEGTDAGVSTHLTVEDFERAQRALEAAGVPQTEADYGAVGLVEENVEGSEAPVLN